MQAPLGVVEVAADGDIKSINQAAVTLLDLANGQPEGQHATDVLPQSAAGTLREALTGTLPTEQSIEEYYPQIDRWLAIDISDTEEGTVLYLRDVTTRNANRQTIDRLKQRLSRLESLDSLVATVLRQVVIASTREEVWETVVRRLGTTDLYEFVWVGERDLTNDHLQVVTTAGDAPDVLTAIDGQLGSESTLPAQRAIEMDASYVVDTIPNDSDIPKELRVAAFSRGLQSAVAVPLSSGGTVSAVLEVYISREQGISSQERASLEALGAVAEFAVNAIRQEDLLFADTVTELRLGIHDSSIPFVAASAATDATLSLEGAVVRDDTTIICYVRTKGNLEQLQLVCEEHSAIVDIRPIESRDDITLAEVSVTDQTPLTVLTDWGATVTDATYTAETAEVVAELPPEGDIRAVVEAVDEQFNTATVRSRTEHTREPETMGAFRRRLNESLTEKQRRVLRTAHLADYFQSPRGSTSEEVAEALDISGPTVLYHLRNAQRKLLDAFFDDEGAADN